jgi:signal transduction histidine kinase
MALQNLCDTPLRLIHSARELRQRPWLGYAIAAVLSAGAYWSSLRLGGYQHGYPFLIQVCVVILAALLGGMRAGLFAALVAIAVTVYSFVEPYGRWRLQWPHGYLTALAFAMTLLMLLGVMQALFDSLRHGARQPNQEQSGHRQKMEALGQLTGGIVHDFNNMLTIITASLEMIRKRIGEPVDPRVLQYLDNADEGAQRAAELVARLLAFARLRPTEPQPINANCLVDNVARLLQRTLGTKVKVETMLADDLCTITADPAQLESALVNLAINARDAMPEGGTLTLSTANAGDFAVDGRHTGRPHVVIRVADTGIGMPTDVARHALDPFFTTKAAGTGLGLSQVRDCVRQSAGHLQIDTAPGRGTTVAIYLPCHEHARAETTPGVAA